MIYAALLRGINVGGNNKISMKELKAACERAGMERVETYIQSGNVVFVSGRSKTELTALWEEMMVETFGLPIRVLLVSLDEMRTIVEAVPEFWTNDAAMRSDVMFLWQEADDASALEQLKTNPDVDRTLYVPGAILWSLDKANYTKSGMNKLIGTRLYKQMTVRNVNTTRKLYALMQEAAKLEASV